MHFSFLFLNDLVKISIVIKQRLKQITFCLFKFAIFNHENHYVHYSQIAFMQILNSFVSSVFQFSVQVC